MAGRPIIGETMPMLIPRLLRVEWDVVAGAIAAVTAMVFHVLGIASEELVRGVLLLLALLLLRDLRQEARGRLFRRQEFFAATVGQVLDNPAVDTIQFLVDERDREHWESHVQPKLGGHACAAKVRPPLWGRLAGGVSFIVGEVGDDGESEALVGILEEPFATESAAARMPRYVLRIQNDSELLDHVVELARHAVNLFEPGHELALRPEDLLRSPAAG